MSGTTSFYTKGLKVSTDNNTQKPKKINASGVRQVKTPSSSQPSTHKSNKKQKLDEDESDTDTADGAGDSTGDETENENNSSKKKSDINIRSIHSMKDLIGKTKTKITIEKLDSEEQSLLGDSECAKFKITVENENGSVKWNEWNTNKNKEKPSETSVLMSLGKDAKKMGEIHEVAPWKKEFGFEGESSEENANKIFGGYRRMMSRLKDMFPGDLYDKFIKLSN